MLQSGDYGACARIAAVTPLRLLCDGFCGGVVADSPTVCAAEMVKVKRRDERLNWFEAPRLPVRLNYLTGIITDKNND